MGKSSIFNTEPYVDTVVDENGKILLADTTRNWRDWKETIDRQIKREELGQKVSGGLDSWNTHWLQMIQALRKKTQNAEKYVEYVIDSRRNLGLPELVFEERNQNP